jgi:hypothetical protein
LSDRSPVPWSIADLRTAILPVLFGTLLLGWAWWEASGTGRLNEQVKDSVFAVLGTAVVLAGSLAWVGAGRRAVRSRTSSVVARFGDVGIPGSVSGASASIELHHHVAVPGTARYHRPDCLLVRGKAAQPIAPDDGLGSGRTPCEMCRP